MESDFEGLAACFRSIGIEAVTAPDSDSETLELGGLYSSGEECLPHRITLGDFLKVCRRPDFEPAKTAFMMPTAHGPCRFGQYGPYLRKQLDEMGYGEAMVFSPTSANGYSDIGQGAGQFIRSAWMGVVCGDIAQKLLFKTRPYELRAGDSDEAFRYAVDQFGQVLAKRDLKPKHRLAELAELVTRVRDRFRSIPARYEKGRPLIGVVGEIFCRHNEPIRYTCDGLTTIGPAGVYDSTIHPNVNLGALPSLIVQGAGSQPSALLPWCFLPGPHILTENHSFLLGSPLIYLITYDCWWKILKSS